MSEFVVTMKKARAELQGKRDALDADIAEIDAMIAKHGGAEEPERARVPSRPPLLMPKLSLDPAPEEGQARKRKSFASPHRGKLKVGGGTHHACEFLFEEFSTRERGAVVAFRDLVASYRGSPGMDPRADPLRLLHGATEVLEEKKLLNRSFSEGASLGATARTVRLLHFSCSDPAAIRAWIDSEKRRSEESAARRKSEAKSA